MNPLNAAALVDVYHGEREKRIVNVGRLTEQKNQAMLLDAFARITDDFPEYTLEIYGEGILRKHLEERAESLGIKDRVVFYGNVSNVCERIRTAQIFAFSSDYEGMPNALAEAMSIGLACVSTDCSPGGARMLIENGKNGLLVPCGDVDLFADALKKFVSDPELAQRIASEAVGIRDKLELDIIANEWEKYLSKVIDRASK